MEVSCVLAVQEETFSQEKHSHLAFQFMQNAQGQNGDSNVSVKKNI